MAWSSALVFGCIYQYSLKILSFKGLFADRIKSADTAGVNPWPGGGRPGAAIEKRTGMCYLSERDFFMELFQPLFLQEETQWKVKKRVS
jgi:hypothetical protein